MKRLTTDDSTSILLGLNLFFAKDGEVWIRGGGPEPDYPDCTLTDWINRAAAARELSWARMMQNPLEISCTTAYN